MASRRVYTGATVAGVDRLGVRELRNQTAATVRRAGGGERILITVDGRPVAQLGPIDPGTTEEAYSRNRRIELKLTER